MIKSLCLECLLEIICNVSQRMSKILTFNNDSFVMPYKYWKFNVLRIISSSPTKVKLKSLSVLLKIELLVGCVSDKLQNFYYKTVK